MFSCLLVFPPCLKGFFLFVGVSLVCWCFFLFGKVFPCLEVFFFSCLLVSHPAHPNPPPKPPRNPKTFRYFVPRGTLIQSRMLGSLLLIALHIRIMQCIDNKANKITMVKGKASPVAITYRPSSNAIYQQNKVSTKYINIPIKNIQ